MFNFGFVIFWERNLGSNRLLKMFRMNFNNVLKIRRLLRTENILFPVWKSRSKSYDETTDPGK